MAKATSKLTNVELVKENGEYYLSLEYLLEDDYKVEKLTIPRAKLPIDPGYYPSICWPDDRTSLLASYEGILLKLADDPDAGLFTFETIKEKEHEMTIEEIEKKLGYKVKIVSGGKKK